MENEYPEIDRLSKRVKKLSDSSSKSIAEYCNRYKKELAIRFIHEATALEGNTLTLEETRSVLKGREINGEELRERKREIQEIRNYFKAFQHVRTYIKRGQELDERIIRNLHGIVTERIYHGGIYRNIPIWVPDTKMEFPAHNDVKGLMRDFTERLKERVMVCRLPESFNPIDLAAWAWAELMRIHPFLEGNERVGALMMNYLLMEHELVPISIPKGRQQEYMEIIDRYRWEREIVPLACLIEDLEKEALLALEQGVKEGLQRSPFPAVQSS